MHSKANPYLATKTKTKTSLGSFWFWLSQKPTLTMGPLLSLTGYEACAILVVSVIITYSQPKLSKFRWPTEMDNSALKFHVPSRHIKMKVADWLTEFLQTTVVEYILILLASAG